MESLSTPSKKDGHVPDPTPSSISPSGPEHPATIWARCQNTDELATVLGGKVEVEELHVLTDVAGVPASLGECFAVQ